MDKTAGVPDQDQVRQRIRDYITQEFLFRKKDAALADDHDLVARGIIDSMGIFRVVSFLEESFAIPVAPTEIVMDNFRSVDAVHAFAMRKLQAAPGGEQG